MFRVDPAESLVVIEVRRAGSLARLGHDHVVASHEVEGFIAPDEGRADLYVALGRMAVDEAPLRAEAGFATQPTESDIEGTRANMLEKVLEAEKFPFAMVRVSGADAKQGNATLDVAITLHGATRTLQAPAQIDADATQMSVTGRSRFRSDRFRHHALLATRRRHRGAEPRRASLPHPRAPPLSEPLPHYLYAGC